MPSPSQAQFLTEITYHYFIYPPFPFLKYNQYVDLDYQEGGIGEYQFFNRHTNQWNTTSCVSENGRCQKFDCHLPETNFKLLGIFKEPNPHSWMEQLFKHEGVCIWTEEEYEFMQQDRTAWPCKCTLTSTTDENGHYLYFDLKPVSEGRITLGLYTDSRCSHDYQVNLNAAEVIVNATGYASNDDDKEDHRDDELNPADLVAELEQWNDAFDIYKTCQPCIAYNLDSPGFECSNAAGAYNVNQCMKFK